MGALCRAWVPTRPCGTRELQSAAVRSGQGSHGGEPRRCAVVEGLKWQKGRGGESWRRGYGGGGAIGGSYSGGQLVAAKGAHRHAKGQRSRDGDNAYMADRRPRGQRGWHVGGGKMAGRLRGVAAGVEGARRQGQGGGAGRRGRRAGPASCTLATCSAALK